MSRAKNTNTNRFRLSGSVLALAALLGACGDSMSGESGSDTDGDTGDTAAEDATSDLAASELNPRLWP